MKLLFRDSQRGHVNAELFSAHLDDQVTAAERARLDAHLRGCAACQAELDGLRQTVTLLRAMPRVPVPRAFTLSEVQVGIRRPSPRTAWLGGAARGLAAVTAVVLVALMAAALLRQPAWTPGPTVARVTPTASPDHEVLSLWAPAAEAPQVMEPTPAATGVEAEREAPVEVALLVVAPPTAPSPVAAAMPEPSPEIPAPAAQPPPEPATRPLATTAALLAEAQTQAAEPSVTPMAPAVTALGLGRDGGVDPGAPSSEALTPAPAPISNVLPAGVGVVYADQQSLWALDRETGARQLAYSPGLIAPLISPGRDWIAYRVLNKDYQDLWVVRWNGQDRRLLLAERDLPRHDLGKAFSERRIQEVRWVPATAILALSTMAIAAEPDQLSRIELWNLDVESGALQYVMKLGTLDRFVYAPDGTQFALLHCGTESNQEGRLSLFNRDGSGGRVALRFPVGANRPGCDPQWRWLPDGSALWAAILDADVAGAGQINGVTLYRVPVQGEAEQIARIEAFHTAWSPNGSRLAYTRAGDGTMVSRELFLANADGSNAQLYVVWSEGEFINWSPDGAYFLYRDGDYVYLGAAGQAPRKLGPVVSVSDPRWITAKQILHLHDQGTGWLLVARTVDSAASSLKLLPRDITYDVTQP
jgi:hypothetical protein